MNGDRIGHEDMSQGNGDRIGHGDRTENGNETVGTGATGEQERYPWERYRGRGFLSLSQGIYPTH